MEKNKDIKMTPPPPNPPLRSYLDLQNLPNGSFTRQNPTKLDTYLQNFVQPTAEQKGLQKA